MEHSSRSIDGVTEGVPDDGALVGGLNAVLEGMNLGIYCLDETFRITHASAVVSALTGIPDHDLVGMSFLDIVTDADRAQASRVLTAVAPAVEIADIRILLPRGGERQVRITHRRSPAGSAVAAVGIMARPPDNGRDAAQDMIRKLSVAVEQSPASVVITDTMGTIEYVNPRFTQLTGFTYNDAIGQNPRILKSGQQPPQFYRELWDALLAGREWHGEFHNLKKSGESYWESASISPLRNNAGEVTHFVAVKENITERKLAEDALHQRNENMERELLYAQAIVSRLLPQQAPLHPTLAVAYRYVPLDAIGGDYFSFNRVADGTLGVFVGDVVGHGVPAALYLAMVKSTTDRLFRHFGGDPPLFLAKLNRELTAAMSAYFLTALYGVVEPRPDGALFRFAKGGHPEPLLVQRLSATARFLPCRGRALGILENPDFEQTTVSMAVGDRLYLYTDGVSETVDREGRMIDGSELAHIARDTLAVSLDESLDRILGALAAYRDGRSVEDDIILVGLEVTV